jgi:hypothetical protein
MIVVKDGIEAELSGARNNSMKGIIGFKPTSQATFPPSISFLYIIGVRKNNACIATVTIYCKSLKNTVAMAKIKAIPYMKIKSNIKAIGTNNTAQFSLPPKAKIIRNNAKNDKRLSIKTPNETLNGKRLLGRYIFFINPSLLIKEDPD